MRQRELVKKNKKSEQEQQQKVADSIPQFPPIRMLAVLNKIAARAPGAVGHNLAMEVHDLLYT